MVRVTLIPAALLSPQLNPTISDGWSVTGSSALGIDQLISFSVLKRDSGLVYQRVFEGIGTNGGNSGRMDGVDEFLDFELDLSSVPSDLQFQLVQIGFANTNSQGVNDPDLVGEEGTSYDPDLVITDFGGMTTVFENIRNGGGMGPVSAGVFDIEVGDVVLGGGSTSIFSFSQSEDPRDFPIDGEDLDSRDVGYSLASFTFDFVEAPTGFAGDFDGDGDVDGNDFLVWQRDPNVGSLTDWQADYGMSAPLSGASAAPVPEPTSLALLSCLLLLATSRRVAV